MLHSPEVKRHRPPSLEEAQKILFGVLLVRPRLKGAILEAFVVDNPNLEPKRGDLKDNYATIDPNYQNSVREAYCLYRQAWEQRRGNLITRVLFPPPPSLEQLKKNVEKDSDRLIDELIIDPLYIIYIEEKGQKPHRFQPWLGQLLIEAAEGTPETQRVRFHLSQFDLNPKTLVKEVRQSLDNIK